MHHGETGEGCQTPTHQLTSYLKLGMTYDVEVYTELDPVGVEARFPTGTSGLFQTPAHPFRIGAEREHDVVSVTRCRSNHLGTCRRDLNRHLLVLGTEPGKAALVRCIRKPQRPDRRGHLLAELKIIECDTFTPQVGLSGLEVILKCFQVRRCMADKGEGRVTPADAKHCSPARHPLDAGDGASRDRGMTRERVGNTGAEAEALGGRCSEG